MPRDPDQRNEPPGPLMNLSPLVGVLLALLVVMICTIPAAASKHRYSNTLMADGCDSFPSCGRDWHTVIVPAVGHAYLAESPTIPLEPWSSLSARVRPSPAGLAPRWRVRAEDGAPMQAVVDALEQLQAHQLEPGVLEPGEP